MPTLLVLKGPLKGEEFELRPGINAIGRNSASCDIVLSHDAVSRRHATVEWTDEGCFLEDLDSHNGTRVNGQRVLPGPTGRVELDDADLIEINGFHLIYYQDETSTSMVLLVTDEEGSTPNILSTVEVSSNGDAIAPKYPTARLRALLRLIEDLGDPLELSDLPRRALESLMGSFALARSGFLLLQEPRTQELRPAATLHRDGVPRRIRVSRTIIDQVIHRKSALRTSDAMRDERFAASQSIAQLQLQSMMCAPLVDREGTVLGVVQLDASGSEKGFSHTDLEVFVGIARHMAMVIENARLHDEALLAQRTRYERQFRDLVEGSIQGILIHRDFRALFVNEAWARYHGHTPAEIMRMETVLPLIASEDRAGVCSHVTRLVGGEAAAAPVEYRGVRKDGSLVWFENIMTPVEWDERPAVQSTIIDVTVRKEAEWALRTSERKYRQLVETSNDLIWSVDREGRWTFVNSQAARRIYGYSAGEMVGRPFTAFMSPEQAERDWLVFEQIQAGKSFLEYETEHLHKDGTPIHMIFNAIAARDQDGHVVGATGTATDITARKRAELGLQAAHDELELRVEQRTADLTATNDRLQSEIHERTQAQDNLRRSERLYQSLVETIPLGVARKDLQGRFTFVNESLCQAFQRPAEQILGYTDYAFFPEPLADKYRRDDQQVIETGHALEFIERFEDDDESSRYIHTIRSPIRDAHGSVIGVQLIVADVTELKQSEQDLRRYSAELERSNRELAQFASVVSHDLIAPLRAIASYSGLLHRRYQGQLDAMADEFLGYIVDGVSRMHTLIHDLQAYARVTTRAKPSRPTDVRDVVRDALSNLEAEIQESGATIECGPLPTVSVDATQLMLVFQNLIANALKYRGNYPPHIELAATFADSEWVFSVSDNGIGIAPHNFERIFIIHQRLHTPEEYPGTGLGLALCKRIVERHGGRIWVESQLDLGTTFYFTLPMRCRHPAPTTRQPHHLESHPVEGE